MSTHSTNSTKDITLSSLMTPVWGSLSSLYDDMDFPLLEIGPPATLPNCSSLSTGKKRERVESYTSNVSASTWSNQLNQISPALTPRLNPQERMTPDALLDIISQQQINLLADNSMPILSNYSDNSFNSLTVRNAPVDTAVKKTSHKVIARLPGDFSLLSKREETF